MAKIHIWVDDELNERLEMLAEVEGKYTSTLVVEILKNYMETRKDDVDNAFRARKAYERRLAKLCSMKEQTI